MRSLTATLLAAVLTASCGGADSAPGALREGREVYGNVCSACHGSAGQGGVGPTLTGVLQTWPSCADHVLWVTLGSDEWLAQVGPTYGATAKPVQGGMPGHGATLSSSQIAAVAAWERVTYGRADEASTLAECGVGE